jgi:hypothetical protein
MLSRLLIGKGQWVQPVKSRESMAPGAKACETRSIFCTLPASGNLSPEAERLRQVVLRWNKDFMWLNIGNSFGWCRRGKKGTFIFFWPSMAETIRAAPGRKR